MEDNPRGRCPAAHPEDPTPCDGPPVVTVLDAKNAGVVGCAHHGARMLASMHGARVVPLPDAPQGTAIDVFKAADGIRPFPWLAGAPRTRDEQLSRAEVRARAAGLAEVVAELDQDQAPELAVPAGPVETSPRGVHSDAEQGAALLAVLAEAGVELGEHDRRIVEWLAGWEWSTVATVASWVRRAGQEPGR
ncbi:hypothetical protein [Streptomyces sp. CAI-85]|uniref:hypothetical protein n=1 Tax=Streptomyces sp. CAI-85 TaxID=1472662 RepID=UPI0020CA7003|nr:hypothetical protein [Streptomyces sp. CAI-85]